MSGKREDDQHQWPHALNSFLGIPLVPYTAKVAGIQSWSDLYANKKSPPSFLTAGCDWQQ